MFPDWNNLNSLSGPNTLAYLSGQGKKFFLHWHQVDIAQDEVNLLPLLLYQQEHQQWQLAAKVNPGPVLLNFLRS